MTETHPGAEPYPAPLRERLAAALAEKGEEYVPRTHHLRDDGSPRYTNRLILEDSPYLLQHAHNPVDWYPWGAEAFERARREDKPIFLSIGYSTCHWCHVMERESFESEEVAALMNRHFVCIKVDREQRPDVDELYMTAVQLLTHHGGWPMSSFLTPAGEPFHGGTYYPPQHFVTLLERVSEAWRQDRSRIEQTAGQLTEAVRRVTGARGQTRKVGEEVLGRAVEQILGRYDEELGGFGNAPKFPHEPELLYLLGHGLRRGDGEALAVAVHSLDAMARGGIYDQVGGGFHRYSTDPYWLVPHFEKMLYNQAHLGRAYLEAHRLTGEPFFARIARQTLDYVAREMTSPEGGFYSATDADSEGHEGTFFLWTPEELREVLRPDDARLAIALWGVRPKGNFEGRSILYLEHPYADFADERRIPLPELLERVDRIREQLWKVREKREHPLRDDKVLTEWNAMMITTFARAAEVLGEPRYLDAAERAAELLWRVARRDGCGLWRVHLDGSSSVTGLQGDYAYLTEALLALYDASGEERWLERAREVADAMVERFWDGDGGGFFMTAEDADPHLPGRPKSPSDGAVPSGNSVAVRALALLAARSGEAGYADRAHATVAAFAETLEQQPSAYSYLLLGLDHLLHGDVGPLAYGAGGAVRARATLEPTADGARLAVELRVRDGWHVNAHRPRQEELIATELSLAGGGRWQLGEVSYPEGEEVRLAFEDDPLRVYTGTVRLTAPLANIPDDAVPGDGSTGDSTAPPVLPVALRLQACDDQRCLKPETLRLEVPAAGGSGKAGV